MALEYIKCRWFVQLETYFSHWVTRHWWCVVTFFTMNGIKTNELPPKKSQNRPTQHAKWFSFLHSGIKQSLWPWMAMMLTLALFNLQNTSYAMVRVLLLSFVSSYFQKTSPPGETHFFSLASCSSTITFALFFFFFFYRYWSGKEKWTNSFPNTNS